MVLENRSKMLISLVILLAFVQGNFALSWVRDFENTRIVGGEVVKIEEAPFIVYITYDDRALCGGSIISTNWILTVS